MQGRICPPVTRAYRRVSCSLAKPRGYLGSGPLSSSGPYFPSSAPRITTAIKKSTADFTTLSSMATRRMISTQDKQSVHNHHSHDHNHDHSHSHSRSVFGSLTHSHSNEDGHAHGVDALKTSGDKGSRITLIGLGANVILTTSKGLAGWYMNSAALLADAGHSLSDLLGDFVTLASWRLSRRPPSHTYPYGFGKFETLGTTAVSILLVGGALGIGFHSYHLLLEALNTTIPTMSPGVVRDMAYSVFQHVPLPEIAHMHGVESQSQILDPNAAWFAAVSVLAKEWLYRVTKKVADEERSSVLFANAVHHRSDAYSSLVALVAILGTWIFPKLPLDPIGGLLVSVVILRQGLSLLAGAFGQLTDRGVSQNTLHALNTALTPLVQSPESHASVHTSEMLLRVHGVRAMRTGAFMFVDLIADVPSTMSVHDASLLEERIVATLKEVRREISEVRVKFNIADVDHEHTRD